MAGLEVRALVLRERLYAAQIEEGTRRDWKSLLRKSVMKKPVMKKPAMKKQVMKEPAIQKDPGMVAASA